MGTYARQLVWLQRPAGTNIATGIATNQLSIARGGRTTWVAGGPLNSTILIESRDDRRVSLNYQLTNGSGTTFHLVSQTVSAPPRFEIRDSDRLVAQGQFEFG
jgi:hypothetical protein